MHFWKWLGKLIKKSIKEAASLKRIKAILMDPSAESLSGLGGTWFFFLFGLVLGVYENRIFHLLLLGIIPSILAIFHAKYRREKRWKEGTHG